METELRKQRRKAGLTQQEVIKRSGIARISYHRYENGERVPDAQTASLIARAVGSTVESLCSLTLGRQPHEGITC